MKTFIILLILCVAHVIQAQTPYNPKLGATTDTEFFGDLMSHRHVKKIKLEGSPYWYDDWRNGEIKYKKKLFKFDSMKYNVFEETLELYVSGEPKLLDNMHLKYFLLYNDYGSKSSFYSGTNYIFEGSKYGSFLEGLYEGKGGSLLKGIDAYIRKENYNIILGTGNKTPSILKKDMFFIEISGILYRVKKQKDLLGLLDNEMKGQAREQIKTLKTKFKHQEDIIKLLETIGF